MDDHALICADLLKPHVVELASSSPQGKYPYQIDDSTSQVNRQQWPSVSAQHIAVDDDSHRRYKDTDDPGCQEGLYAGKVLYAHEQVANHLGIEEGDLHLHHLLEKMGYHGNADTAAYMQGQPTGYVTVESHAQAQGELADQYADDEACVTVLYAYIDHCLCEVWKHKADE